MARKLLVFTAFLGVLSVPSVLYGWVAASSYGPDATGEVYFGMGLAYSPNLNITPDKAKNSRAFNWRIGYHFVDWFSLQFDFDKFDTDVETYMVTARLWDRFYSTRPFLSVSLGLLDAPDFGKDPCAKLGGGVEYFPNEDISFGGELAYIMGFNDLSYIDDIILAVGASLHF